MRNSFISTFILFMSVAAHAFPFGIICSYQMENTPYKNFVAIMNNDANELKVVEAWADGKFRDIDLHNSKRMGRIRNGDVAIFTSQPLSDGALLNTLYNFPQNFDSQEKFQGLLKFYSRLPKDITMPIAKPDYEVYCEHGHPKYVK